MTIGVSKCKGKNITKSVCMYVCARVRLCICKYTVSAIRGIWQLGNLRRFLTNGQCQWSSADARPCLQGKGVAWHARMRAER